MSTTTMYKVLSADGKSCNGGNAEWSLPTQNDDGSWCPGEWMPEIDGELVPCKNGYHLCRRQDLLCWLGDAIFEAEYSGEIVEGDDKIVVRQVRLLSRLEAWNERTARLFAADCAEQVLHLFEREHSDDKRPRLAIEAARRFANGEIDRVDLAAAWAAAWAAASDAAGAAAWDAASDAAWAAARAAWDAARDAAWDAARDAAWAAARAAAREQQTALLFEYLD